jgi:hypothetical protein
MCDSFPSTAQVLAELAYSPLCASQFDGSVPDPALKISLRTVGKEEQKVYNKMDFQFRGAEALLRGCHCDWSEAISGGMGVPPVNSGITCKMPVPPMRLLSRVPRDFTPRNDRCDALPDN